MPTTTRRGLRQVSGDSNDLQAADEEMGQSRLVTRSASDAYFTQVSMPAQTSSHVFSDLVLPLSQDEYLAAIRPAICRSNPPAWNGNFVKSLFSLFALELDEGFNILFYGFGSKRDVLNQFAAECCLERGHAV